MKQNTIWPYEWMEVAQMIIELEIALDGANLSWAHGVLLGLTCISLIAVTFNRWLKTKTGTKPLKPINMVKIDVPFSVSMDDNGKKVSVTCCIANKVEVYWDFNIRKFYTTLTRRWSKGEPVLKPYLWSFYESDESNEIIKTFDLYEQDVVQNSVPRNSFPVAVVVRNYRKNVSLRDVIGLIAVIELGDPLRKPSFGRVVGRYLKLANGRVIPLQRYFASGLCHENLTDMCVVCRDSPVTRVALPCRHACFCAPCFERVEKCSMCTAEIATYFCIEPGVDDVD